MSDLISRSALIEIMSKWKFGAISRLDERAYIKETVLELIKAQPTAYDMEKVVAELEEEMNDAKNHWDEDDYYTGKANAFEHSIEIVRKGGVK